MTCRCTIKLNNGVPTGVKGILPDEILTESERSARQAKIDDYNSKVIILDKQIKSRLNNVEISWCEDGTAVISCTNLPVEVEQLLSDLGFDITTDKANIKHRIKKVVVAGVESQEEDIDEVLEQDAIKAKNKLKSRVVVNQFKLKTMV